MLPLFEVGSARTRRDEGFNETSARCRAASTPSTWPRESRRVSCGSDAVEVASCGAASRRRRSAQGKTKVILPLFCMAFLSSNKAVRDALARGGREKRCLVV